MLNQISSGCLERMQAFHRKPRGTTTAENHSCKRRAYSASFNLNMKALIMSTALILGALSTQAAIQTKTVEYQQNGDTLEGVLVWDDATAGKRPGVLIVHQWLGLTDYEIGRAKQLAGLEFASPFCADIYGKGIRPTNTDEAGKARRQVQIRTASFCVVARSPR